MDEYAHSPSQINSAIDMNKVPHTSIPYLNKKRKFLAEQLGMPFSKHPCLYQTLPACDSSVAGIGAEEFLAYTIKVENDESRPNHDSELESGKDSNSINGDADSVMSSEAKADFPSLNSDKKSTSSFNCGGNWSKGALYSLENRSMPKSKFLDRLEQASISREWNALLDYEENLLEFESQVDCDCPESKSEGIEPSTEKEVDDLLYSDGVNLNDYVLSSGKWTLNQDADSPTGDKKLTIDKEFEQYFSMLML